MVANLAIYVLILGYWFYHDGLAFLRLFSSFVGSMANGFAV